jgi:hypothetical protein
MSLPSARASLDFTPRPRQLRERPSLASLAWPALALASSTRLGPATVQADSPPPGRLALTAPGHLVHVGAGLRAGSVVQPGRPGHFGGAHEAAGELRHLEPAASDRRAGPAGSAAPLLADCSFEQGPSRIRARAQARSALGRIELTAHCQAPGDSLLPAAIAGGGWMDRLTVQAGALRGQAGEMSIALHLNAALQAGNNGVAAARLVLGLWVDGVAVPLLPSPCWGGRPRRGEPALAENLACLVVARVPVVFGQPFELAVFALARAGAEPALPPPPVLPSAASATASVAAPREGEGASIHWAGLRGVHAIGRERPLMHAKQYRLESASGRDWREPAAARSTPA